jgi:DNA repair protein RecO (recombination protein O)
MPLVETESLVLKTYNLAEADKIVLLFTREHGIVRGVAKGAKRLKSRFGSGLEPLSVVRASYFQKETLELVSLQNIELVESNFTAASNPEFLEKFAYLIDILVTAVPPHDPNETLYRMVCASLRTASHDLAAIDAVVFYFEIWLLRLTGYLPNWARCGICQRGFDQNETAGLGTSFELVCGNCRRLTSMTQITAAQRAMMADVMRLSPDDFSVLAISATDLYAVSDVMKRVLSNSLGQPVSGATSYAAGSNAQ